MFNHCRIKSGVRLQAFLFSKFRRKALALRLSSFHHIHLGLVVGELLRVVGVQGGALDGTPALPFGRVVVMLFPLGELVFVQFVG